MPLRERQRKAVAGVAIADEPEDLAGFATSGCAAAIWRRQPARAFQGWIDALDPERLPRGRLILAREAVRGALHQLCEIAGTPGCTGREILVDDAAALSNLFAEVMQARYLRLRLDVVTTNACSKFHVDAISARLVCTYRGAGTQYGISQGGGEPARVFTVPTGAPILLRGSPWPSRSPTGLLHRSPPIEGTGAARLVLVIDPVLDPGEEA